MAAQSLGLEANQPINTLEDHEAVQVDSVKTFGFWVYLMSDVVLFATLFATYAVLSQNFAGGPTGQTLFDLRHTLIETLLLLFSSLSCGLAMLAVHRQDNARVLLWFFITLLLGLGFIGMEITEFHNLIIQGAGPDRSGFLSGFFTLVGTHGLHVSFGLLWILVMLGQVFVKGLTIKVRSRLLRLSLFWHFLDVVWIGVFTVVYLLGAM